MKKTRILSLLLAVVLIVLSFAGCSGSGANDDSAQKVEFTSFPEQLTVEKIGTLDSEVNIDYFTDNGFSYVDTDSEKYGVMSLDGKSDTGAIYTYVDTEEDYFLVTTKDLSDNSLETLNSFGVIDGQGNMLVPESYAAISCLSERYFYVCEVTEQTTSEDEALVYYTNSLFAFGGPGEDDILYKGNWYVYDAVDQKVLDGVTGTTPASVSAYGNFVKYYDEASQRITVNNKGEVLADEARLFEDGSYSIDGDNICFVYDTDGNKLFEYNLDDFDLRSYDDEYYIASKSVGDDNKYVFVDKQGQVVSGLFDEFPKRYGELVESDYKLYKLDGTPVYGITFDSVNYDDFTKNCWMINSADTYTLIDKDGLIIGEITESEFVDVYTTDFAGVDNTTGYKKAYCLKTDDFTIDCSNISCRWIAYQNSDDGSSKLIDTISGNTLLDGYDGYESILTDQGLFIYAQNMNSEDADRDIYIVK